MGMRQPKRQAVDHGGNFVMWPRRVTASVAWRHASFRARAILMVFCQAFTGRNNGDMVFSIRAIGQAIGSANHGLTSRAVAELIELGFLECTSDANRAVAKARTYRITFISTLRATQSGEEIVPATHEYDTWRPVKKRKFGAVESPTTSDENATVSPTMVKKCVGGSTTCFAQKPQKPVTPVVGDSTTLLSTTSPGSKSATVSTLQLAAPGTGDSLLADVETLRRWARQAVNAAGYGGNNQLAADAGMSAVELSRFRNGRSLPAKHHAALQAACARILTFDRLSA